MKKIAIGNDHAGYRLKLKLVEWLEARGYQIEDFGTNGTDSVDYPDYVHSVARSVAHYDYPFGILICGSGQGVSITANKYLNIRAAVCWETEIALLARKHNDANILCLPARFLSDKMAIQIALFFLQTEFESGRHLKRIEKMNPNYYC